MEDKKNIEDEEYKKRIQDLVENLEKTNDKDSQYTEQDIIEEKEKVLQILTRKTHESKYRNEFIIAMLTYWIHSLYKFRTEKNQSQEEIDALYKLIYEQLKKPHILIPNPDPNKPNITEIIAKKMILRNLERLLGEKNVKSFKKKYKINKLINENLTVKRLFYLIVIFGCCVFLPLFFAVWYLFF